MAMTEGWRYTHSNVNYIGSKIKVALRDCERGAISRESCALTIQAYLEQITQRTILNQMSLDEVGKRVQEHLKGNRRGV